MIYVGKKSLIKIDVHLNVQLSVLMALAAEGHLAERQLQRFEST
jgi:hypothetical protein